MRLANISDRLSLITPAGMVVDISQATGGRISPGVQECYDRWDEVLDVARTLEDPRRPAGRRTARRLRQSGSAPAPGVCHRAELRGARGGSLAGGP